MPPLTLGLVFSSRLRSIVALLTALLAVASCQPRGGAVGADDGRLLMAVLPFELQGADESDEFLRSALADEAIDVFGRLSGPGLSVAGISTSLYLGDRLDQRARLADEAGIELFLRGTAARDRERLDLTLELLPARGGTALMTESRSCEFKDLCATLAEIAGPLVLAATAGESGVLADSVMPLACRFSGGEELFLRARERFLLGTEEALEEAAELFGSSAGMDEEFASGYEGMGLCRLQIAQHEQESTFPHLMYARARSRCRKGLSWDDHLPRAHAVVATVSMVMDWDWGGSEKSFLRSLELDPSYVRGHIGHSVMLAARGDAADAVAAARIAVELDPLSAEAHTNLGSRLRESKDLAAAIAEFKRAIALDPEHWLAHVGLGNCYREQGKYDEALAVLDEALALSLGSARVMGVIGHTLAVAGRADEAKRTAAELAELAAEYHVSPYHQAVILAGLGETQAALAELEAAFNLRSGQIWLFNVEPMFDALRSDVRFNSLLKRARIVH